MDYVAKIKIHGKRVFSTSHGKAVVCLFVILFGFLFFNLGRQDMLGDDGTYSFRSIKYFDYMASSNNQTTPVQWFGERPVWSLLSFHDHPMFTFLINKINFTIFGLSVFSSRVPTALAILFLFFVVYFFGLKIGGKSMALFSVFALVVNNYLIWTGRIALLEGLFMFFMYLGLLYLFKALDGQKDFKLAGLFLGLAFLSKYLFLFFVPGIIFFIIWKKRNLLKNKDFWFGVLIFFVVSSPIIIYNIAMLATRGHFDLQFSGLFGQTTTDWSLGRGLTWGNLTMIPLARALIDGFSLPYFIVFVISIFYILKNFKKQNNGILFLLFVFIFVCIFLSLTGTANRWLGILAPFSAMFIGYFLSIFSVSKIYNNYRYLWILLGSAVFIFSAFFIINTNHLNSKIEGKYLSSSLRVENYGYNQLDKKLNEIYKNRKTSPEVVSAMSSWFYSDIKPDAIDFNGLNIKEGEETFILVYDANVNWFPSLWVFERRKLYDRHLIMNSDQFLKLQEVVGLDVLKELRVGAIFFIKAGLDAKGESRNNYNSAEIIEQSFIKEGILPEIVNDTKGREAFYIYFNGQK